MNIDLIGDIHGHVHELVTLLDKLGYTLKNGVYSHPEKKVIFLGDYIDRGPKIVETLAIVKAMVDAKQAIALMGNHEYNAVCFHTKNPTGGYLREHSIKNISQHYETLHQFKNNQSLYNSYIDWFKTLPLFFENDSFRAVHAAWDFESIAYLQKHLVNACLSNDLFYQSTISNTPLFTAVEKVLKGSELTLPNNLCFYDKDGNQRQEIRTKWWLNPYGLTYKQISVLPIDGLPDVEIEYSSNNLYYLESHKPVFFGHYWLQGKPIVLRDNVCCLDYSVAKKGHLVGYRFNGEKDLNVNNLIYV